MRVVGAATAVAVVATGAEVLHRRAEATAPPPSGADSCAVVVLGFPTLRSGAPSPVQRWRVKHAVRAVQRHDADVLVCSGGAVSNQWVEAEAMAAVAAQLGVDDSRIVVEGESPNSWENVKNCKPLTELASKVVLVSDPLHAARCRTYWLSQFPEDTGRIFVEPIERQVRDTWILVPSAVIEVARRARDLLR